MSHQIRVRFVPGWLAWSLVLLALVSCEDGTKQMPTESSARARPHGPLLTAEDTLEFMGPPREQDPGVSIASSAPGIRVHAGDVVTVSVSSMENGRCETVTVSGAASATLWTGIGSPTACNGAPSPVTLPAIAADGELVFDLPLIGNTAQVSGSGTRYIVAFEDGGDGDFNDIVLQVDIAPLTGPRLVCTAQAERGQEVVCTARGEGVAVTGWAFADGGIQVTSTSTDSVWRGLAVLGGTVTANVTVNGAAASPLTSSFTVTNRPSAWRQNITHRRGPELTAPDAEPQLAVRLGQNCPEIDGTATCVATRRVQPDPFQLPEQGYDVSQVPAGGPNAGLWYVSAVRYEMKRVSNANPGVLSSSARTHPIPNGMRNQCRNELGLAQAPTALNFHDYNRCKRINMAAFVAAVFGHEEFGYNGGTGHEGLGQAAAFEAANDPYAALDSLVYADKATLVTNATRIATDVADRITNRAADPNPTGNWPTGTIWFWDASANQYRSYTLQGF